MPYKEYALRAPTVQDAIDSAKAALNDAGLDPYALDVLRLGEDGNDELGRVVDAVEANRWFIEDPVIGEAGNVTQEGTKGGYALINVRTKDPTLQDFIEQFNPKDPSKQPDEIPPEEKIGTGLHRIDEAQINSPERVWATAGN